MLGDGFGFRHARIVNHNDFIAARADQQRRERENQNCKKFHVPVFDLQRAEKFQIYFSPSTFNPSYANQIPAGNSACALSWS